MRRSVLFGVLILLVMASAVVPAFAGSDTYIHYNSQAAGNLVLDQAHQQVFVSFENQDRVDVYSTVDYKLLHSIQIKSPQGMDLSPDGTTVAITNRSSHISFFNTVTYAKTDDVVWHDSLNGISTFLYTANGDAYVRAELPIVGGGGATAFWNHTANTFTVVGSIYDIPPRLLPYGIMARSGDYSRLILGDSASTAGKVQVVDMTNGSLLTSFSLDIFVYGVAANSDGTRYAACDYNGVLYVYDSSFNEIYRTGPCLGLTISGDGSTLYRDVTNSTQSGMNTVALDLNTFTKRSTSNLYWNSNFAFATFYKAASSNGMVYGFSGDETGYGFVAIDTTQSTTPSIPAAGPLKIVKVLDSVGTAAGGDDVRVLVSGLNISQSASVTVKVGGVAATNINVSGTNLINTGTASMVSFISPAGTPGYKDITISASSGSDTAHGVFQYANTAKIFPFATAPNFLLYDSARQLLYAANGSQVEVIDANSQQVLTALVPAGGKLSNSQFGALSLSPDGARLFIADTGAKLIHVLNLNSPGTGYSYDPGALMGSPQSISPMRVDELESGRVIGYSQLAGFPIFLVDSSHTSAQFISIPSITASAVLYGTSKDGKFALVGSSFVGGGQAALWSDTSSAVTTDPGTTQGGGDFAIDDDGLTIADGNFGNYFPEVLGSDLHSQGLIEQIYYMQPPMQSAGLTFQSGGALLYRPGHDQKGTALFQTGRVSIYDVNHAELVGNIDLQDIVAGSVSPSSDHMLAADPSGRTFFVSTQSGIEMVVLNSLPLSVGHITPAFSLQGGDTVTIRGSGFVSGATASLGGVAASTTFVDENTLTAVVPSSTNAGYVDVKVVNPDGASYVFADAVTVAGLSTTTSLTLSASSANYGEAVTLSIKVTSPTGIPIGNVNIYGLDITNPQKFTSVALDSSGNATYSTNTLTPGINYVHAVYPLQGRYLQSSSLNAQVQVQQLSTTILLTTSPSPARVGQSVTLSATVQAVGIAATGTVDFYEGSNLLGTGTVHSGAASLTVNNFTGGSHTVTAYYRGDIGHSTSSGTATVTVQDFSLSASSLGSLTVTSGKPATFNVTVSPVSGFTGPISMSCTLPSGMFAATCSATAVQITDGNAQNSVVTVNTTARQSSSNMNPFERLRALFGFLVPGVVFTSFARCKRVKWFGPSLLAMALIVIMTACGGGGGNSGGGGPSVASYTLPGTYNITITASSGGTQHTLTETIVVQ